MDLQTELRDLVVLLASKADDNWEKGTDKNWAEWLRERHLGQYSAYRESYELLNAIINSHDENHRTLPQ